MIRLLGISDEERLAIEQASGMKTEAVKLIFESVQKQAEEISKAVVSQDIRELQEVVGPHGSVTRLQAGGVKISQGLGVSVYTDGVKVTTIEPDGDLLVGSNIEDPATTTMCAFTNEQIYNNELMGAGDLLIGDNSSDTSNVKYDASEGQLQFRLGTTVNVYVDTDGVLKAGSGVVQLDANGVDIDTNDTELDQNSYKFSYNGTVVGGVYLLNQSGTYLYLKTKNSTLGNVSVSGVGSDTGIVRLIAIGSGSVVPTVKVANESGVNTIILNSSVQDVDTIIKGDSDQNLIYADASADKVGFGLNNPSEKVDVSGNVNVSGSYKVGGVDLIHGTHAVCEGRLTLETGVPISTSDQMAKTTVYFTPYKGNKIGVYSGSAWSVSAFTERSASLAGLTADTNYDVFIYNNSGTLTLELTAWTNATTRATALTLQDGVYVKSGATTRRYLGTIRITGTTGQCEDSATKRYVWNMYNRINRYMQVLETTNTWNYTTDTIRQANGGAGNKVEFVLGVAGDAITADAKGTAYLASNSLVAAKVGVGLDTTTAFSGLVQGGYNASAGGIYTQCNGVYRGTPSEGYHYLSWNEKGADGTCTFIGDNNGDGQQSGLSATIML